MRYGCAVWEVPGTEIMQFSNIIQDHGDLDFSAQRFTQKPALQYHPGTLAVLVGYNQAQTCLQYDPKGFQKLLQN